MKKRMLAVILSVALVCGILPSALSVTAVAEPMVTEITATSDTEHLISVEKNVLKKANATVFEANGDLTGNVSSSLDSRDYGRTHNGAIDTYYKLSNKYNGSVWIEYDFYQEFAFSEVLMAGSFNKAYGFEGVDVYICDIKADQLIEDPNLAVPTYSTTDVVYMGRRVTFAEEAYGRYLIFRLGGRTASDNVGGVWISELAAIGRDADEPIVTEIDNGVNEHKIIAAQNNVLTQADGFCYVVGDGNGWGGSTKENTTVITDPLSSVLYDGVLFSEYKAFGNNSTGEVWIQYYYEDEYEFDSLLVAGTNDYSWAEKGQGLYGFDVYVGNKNYEEILEDGSVQSVYSTTDLVIKGRRIELTKKAVGHYLVFRVYCFGESWCECCWISELAATGRSLSEPDVTEIDSADDERIIAPDNNILTLAKATRYTMGDGYGWGGDTSTNVVVNSIPSFVHDGRLFGTTREDFFELGDSFAGDVWIEYAFDYEATFDSFLVAGLDAELYGTGMQMGLNGFDVYVGNQSFEEIRTDQSATAIYSTADNVSKGRLVTLAKAVTGRYFVIRTNGSNLNWCDITCITELAATGNVPYPNTVTDISTETNTEKLVLSHQNLLKKAAASWTRGDDTDSDGKHDVTNIKTEALSSSLYDGTVYFQNSTNAWWPSDQLRKEVFVQYDFGEDYSFDSVLLAAGGGNPEDTGCIYGFDVYIGDATIEQLLADTTASSPVYSTTDILSDARRIEFGMVKTGRYLIFRLGGFTKTWNVGQCWISELAATGRAVNASDDVSAMADVYVPQTGIVNPPVVVQQVTDALPSVDKALPAVAVMDIDAELNVLAADGTVLTTVDAFCKTYSAYVIGAYVVDSVDDVTALTAYLTQKGIVDAYVFAAERDMALVTMAWQTIPTLRCGIICESIGVDNVDWADLCAAVYDDTGVTQVISAEPVSAEAMTYFNLRGLAVWSVAADTVDVYRAISAGYHAVVAADPSLVYTVYENITETTVSGRPLPISHRGATMAHGKKADAKGENTIDGFKQAYAYGYLGVEADLRITKACDPATCTHTCADHGTCSDCQPNIVLHHDWNLDRTTDAEELFGANLTTKDLTMAQLRTLTVDYLADLQGWTGSLCTLEEALAATEDIGLVYYCHINDPEIIDLFNAVFAAHPEYVDNCVVFASPDNIADTFGYDDVTAPLPFVFGDTDANQAYMKSQTDAQTVLQYFREMMNPYGGNPIFYTISYANFNGNDAFYYKSAARGFLTYHTITNDDTELNKALLTKNGAVGLLTDTIWCTADWHTGIAVQDTEISLLPGDTLQTAFAPNYIDQIGEQVSCSFVQLSGPELTYSETAGGYVAPDGAVGDAVVVYYYDGTANGDEAKDDVTYRVYSSPVTVKIGSATASFQGVQLRDVDDTAREAALRFGFQLPCEGVDYKDADGYQREIADDATVMLNGTAYPLVDFGVLVSNDKNADVTMESVTNRTVKKVPAENLYSVSDDVVTFTAVVVGIPESHFNTILYTRSYICYRDGDTIKVVYGNTQAKSVRDGLAIRNKVNE